MPEIQHTPGPYIITRENYIATDGASGKIIAAMASGNMTDSERQANAVLFLMAPEIYDSFEEVVEELDSIISTVEDVFAGYNYQALKRLERAQRLIYSITGRNIGRPIKDPPAPMIDVLED